jgi:hypothetical protein
MHLSALEGYCVPRAGAARPRSAAGQALRQAPLGFLRDRWDRQEALRQPQTGPHLIEPSSVTGHHSGASGQFDVPWIPLYYESTSHPHNDSRQATRVILRAGRNSAACARRASQRDSNHENVDQASGQPCGHHHARLWLGSIALFKVLFRIDRSGARPSQQLQRTGENSGR